MLSKIQVTVQTVSSPMCSKNVIMKRELGYSKHERLDFGVSRMHVSLCTMVKEQLTYFLSLIRKPSHDFNIVSSSF